MSFLLLSAQDHLYHRKALARDDPHLIDIFVLRLHLDSEHGRLNDATLQAVLAPANRLDRVDQDIAPLRLVLVLGRAWAL